MTNAAPILCVENRRTELEELSARLSSSGYSVVGALSAADALDVIHSKPIEGVLINSCLHDADAMELRERMQQVAPELPILLFHGSGDLREAQITVFEAYIEHHHHSRTIKASAPS